MFLLFYNIIQILALLLLWPIVAVVVFFVPKYRGRFGKRLGLGLKKVLLPEGRKRIWIHALSVGESSSAKPLIAALKREYPEVVLIFSTTTKGGEKIAESMKGFVDFRVPFPVDISFVVTGFVRYLRPDLFILIETDFWPNVLHQLRKNRVPCMLANGRVTEESFQRYKKCMPLFRQLFDSFDSLYMQTEKDAANMLKLGVEPYKVENIGNLKYDMADIPAAVDFQGKTFRDELHISAEKRLFVAGSTHPGEEEIVLRVFNKLQNELSDLLLVIAPRDVSRGEEIVKMAQKEGLEAWRRAGQFRDNSSVLVLDTLGELIRIYTLADIVFIGGSMVAEGGHNPLEPAFFGKPVVYGECMTDFSEIIRDLEEVHAAETIKNEEELFRVLFRILSDDVEREQMGERGSVLVRKHRGAAGRYVERIGQVMQL